MRSLRKVLLAAAGVALSGFLVSACAKDPFTAPVRGTLPTGDSMGATMNNNVGGSTVNAQTKESSGAKAKARKRSGYMVSAS